MPDAQDRIVVYDAQCNLCSGWVRFFDRNHVEPPFVLLPMQGASGRALLIEHGIDPNDPLTFLVLDRGEHYTASDATIHLMTAAGGTWRLFHAARIVPRAWRDALYRIAARNRFRWFGRRASRDLPGDRS